LPGESTKKDAFRRGNPASDQEKAANPGGFAAFRTDRPAIRSSWRPEG
jgi:hypothetical protein